MMETMSDHIEIGSRTTLAAFLTAFSLLATFLIAQFMAGITALAHKNNSALAALLRTPKIELSRMKTRVDELVSQALGEDSDNDDDASLPSEEVRFKLLTIFERTSTTASSPCCCVFVMAPVTSTPLTLVFV